MGSGEGIGEGSRSQTLRQVSGEKTMVRTKSWDEQARKGLVPRLSDFPRVSYRSHRLSKSRLTNELGVNCSE